MLEDLTSAPSPRPRKRTLFQVVVVSVLVLEALGSSSASVCWSGRFTAAARLSNMLLRSNVSSSMSLNKAAVAEAAATRSSLLSVEVVSKDCCALLL